MIQHKRCSKELIVFILKKKGLSRNITAIVKYLKAFHMGLKLLGARSLWELKELFFSALNMCVALDQPLVGVKWEKPHPRELKGSTKDHCLFLQLSVSQYPMWRCRGLSYSLPKICKVLNPSTCECNFIWK